MKAMTNKQHALIALRAFADNCLEAMAGKNDQVRQIIGLTTKAEALSDEWYDAQGYSLHTGHGSNVADGRAVAQAVSKAKFAGNN